MYNWDFVFGLEQIVEWCRAHGVKVLFTILDNWSPVDSKTAVRVMVGQACGLQDSRNAANHLGSGRALTSRKCCVVCSKYEASTASSPTCLVPKFLAHCRFTFTPFSLKCG